MTAQFPYNNPYERKTQSGGYVNRYNNPIVRGNRNEYLANAQVYAATRTFTGIDPEQHFQMADNGYPVNAFRDYSAAYEAMIADERRKLAETIKADPDKADAAAAETLSRIEKNNETLSNEVLGQYYDIVMQDPSMEDQDEFTKKAVAARLYLNTEMARIADKAGITDWAGALLVPDMSIQIADFLNEYYGKDNLDAYVNSAEYLAEIGRMYNGLEPEQKIEFVEELKNILPGITSNELKQLEILMGATGQTGEKSMQIYQSLDKFDAITLGLTAGLKAGQVISRAARGTNVVKALSRGGNTDVVALAADEVLTSPTEARKYGVTPEEMAYAADPRQTAELDSILNGAPTGVATDVRNKLEAIDTLVEESSNIVDQGLGLSAGEKMRVQQTRIARLEKQMNLQDVKVVSQNDQGFSISYKELDADGNLIEGEKFVTYTVDDVTGAFVDKESSFVSNIPILNNIIGTGAKVGRDKRTLLYGYEQIDFASRKMGHNLKQAFNQATKGMNKKSIEKINYVLMRGDDAGEVFSYDKLVNEGLGGTRLTDSEYASYVATRRVMDNLWMAKNAQVRRDLASFGIKDVNVNGTWYKAKEYETPDSAKAAYANLSGSTVRVENPLTKDGSSGILDNLTPEDLDMYYDNGYRLVRANSEHPNQMFKSDAAGHSNWALVHSDGISDLGPYVLNYRQGYVPRAYDKAHYFVKKKNYATVDGTPTVAGTSTLRYFDNIDDAEKYVDQLRQAADDAGEAFDPKDYAVLGDREMTSAELDSEVISMWGGLYSGTRTEEGIKFGLAGTEGTRISAIESMQDYMEHIATRYPMSQYRMGIERRWMNHAKDTIPEMRGFNGGFKDARSVVENSMLGNTAAKKKLLDAHDQIEFMNRTPTVGEEQTAGAIKKVADSFARFKVGGKQPLKPLAKAMGNLNKADPVAAARTAAFHMYLGFFNPAQFFVQGMGATVAISMSPIHASKGLTKLPGFAILDQILDPKARAIQLKTFAKKFGGSEFEEAYKAWQKSGLYESAVITNADAYSLYKGLPISQGAMGKMLEKGTFFFKAGELVNLRMSFLTAYQKWRKINPNKKLDDNALKGILAETEKFRLHMTNANKGDFQKGILSVPTQFMQISVRYMEALLGKELSHKERAMFVLGQASLFGAAGVPFGKAVLEKMLGVLGVDPYEMSSEDQIKVQRGMIGWMMNDYLDIDAAFTSRVAIGQGFTDTLQQFIAGEETTLPDLLLGPFGGVVDQSLKVLSDAAFAKQGVMSADDLTPTDLALLSTVIGESLASLPSSTRNLLKAMYLQRSGAFRDSQGNLIMSSPDPKIRNVIAQGMGFSSQDVSDFWEVVIDNRQVADAKKAAVDIIMRNYQRMFDAARNNDQKQQRAFTLMLKATYSMFENPKDRREVVQSVLNRMQTGGARVDKEVRAHIEWLGSELGAEANSWVPLINEYREERAKRADNL